MRFTKKVMAALNEKLGQAQGYADLHQQPYYVFRLSNGDWSLTSQNEWLESASDETRASVHTVRPISK